MKLKPVAGYLTGEWMIVKPKDQPAMKFEMINDEKDVANVEVVLRILDAGDSSKASVGDLVFTGIQFNAGGINPYGQLIPDESIFATIDPQGREVQNYVEWATE